MHRIQSAECRNVLKSRQKQSPSDRQAPCFTSLLAAGYSVFDACQHKRVSEMLHAVTWKDHLKADAALLMHPIT